MSQTALFIDQDVDTMSVGHTSDESAVPAGQTSDEACKKCAPSDDDKVSDAGTESEDDRTTASHLVLWGSDYLESITSVNDQISDYDIIRDELITRMQHDYNNRATGRVSVSTHTIGTLAVSKESSPVGSALLIRKIEMQTEHKAQLLFARHCSPIVMALPARYFNDGDNDAFILHADESFGLFATSASPENNLKLNGLAGNTRSKCREVERSMDDNVAIKEPQEPTIDRGAYRAYFAAEKAARLSATGYSGHRWSFC